MIHDTAIIHESAHIGDNVSIGPYCYIGSDVTIGDNCKLESHVVIKGETKIGQGNHFYQFCSIGEDCQDKKYAGESTQLLVGDNNIFRECVTVHRGTTQDQGLTSIGSNNLFMAYVHIAHDCVIGNNVIMANNASCAGHAHLGDWAIMGGMSGIHQFCHIGAHSFVAAGAIMLRDLPPFVMAGGNVVKPYGINTEGLKRRGFSKEEIMNIRRAYKVLYRNGLTVSEAIDELKESAEQSSSVKLMMDFVANSPRGIIR
ncbi:acyl-ACP--UDP-N-acetylglucosamine O-acyltransferase [Alteromonadaceae bacterium M269]|nr:acyl-ACP--UDP-N-acetylglucosamine O-acyltransferase [Alteromonadaceae bacterium M269]